MYILKSSVASRNTNSELSYSFQNNIEEVDPRGRTPLHLAVSLGHLESARVLLRHGADVTKENDKHWTGESEACELH